MEADVAGEIVKRLEDTGKVTVGVLVMDEDSTTIARIRAELSHEIEKWSGIMHVKNHLQGALYKLANKHKSLTSDLIKYLVDKCVAYAVAQHKGNPDELEKVLLSIVPHAFGNHNTCGKWCQYKENPETYQHKYLPNGMNLQSEKMQSDLSNMFTDRHIWRIFKRTLHIPKKAD